MSLDSYTNLKLEIAAFAARADLSTTSGGLDTYIDLFESWFNRNMRVNDQIEGPISVTADVNGIITPPADLAQWKQIALVDTKVRVLPRMSETAVLMFSSDNVAGKPKKTIIRGRRAQVWPVPDSTSYTYRALYYSKLPALSASRISNWLLLDHPDIYLLGSLVRGFAYIQAYNEAINVWQQAFMAACNELEQQSIDDQYSESMDSSVLPGIV